MRCDTDKQQDARRQIQRTSLHEILSGKTPVVRMRESKKQVAILPVYCNKLSGWRPEVVDDFCIYA
jgi:hypothetical protein